MSKIQFPGETPAYRAARDALLRAEIELSRKTEEVAALRRALGPGSPVATDYAFDGADGEVKLSALFGDKSTLVLYCFMYGPNAKQPCPMCTSFLDGLDAQAHHLGQRVALAVVARSPIERVRAFATERGWSRLRLLSSSRSTYQRDYHGESDEGSQLPMMNLFTKKGGEVRHFWGSEMLYEDSAEGQDSRHIDALWPLWNVLDLTPEGRGADWYPRLRYG